MALLQFFDPDTRTSAEKLALIEEHGESRMAEMEDAGFLNFDFDYWDNPSRTAGYGGYSYDGRYAPVARRMVDHYGLRPGARVLEVGSGKGFLLVEFKKLGLAVTGVDLSSYAVENAHPDVQGDLIRGSILDVDLGAERFDLVLAKDSLPHLDEQSVELAVARCATLADNGFFEVEVARSDYEREMLFRWDVTHQTRRPPEWWLDLFARNGYEGDYHFKVLVEDPSLHSLA
jgi:protein-L-isoaspartate(D-aspartate) O-methyltransferase